MTIIKLFLLFLLPIAYSFNPKCEDIPLLIPTVENKDKKTDPLFIYDNCVSDSFNVIYTMIVQFHYPFADVDKEIRIDTVSLNRLTISNFGDEQKRSYLSEDEITDAVDKQIWNSCSEKLSKWYKSQPYKHYYYSRNEFTGKRVQFGGKLQIMPQRMIHIE